MRTLLVLVCFVFGLSFTALSQDRDLIKEKIQTAKGQVRSGVAIMKSAKENALQIRDAVKSGQMTKEEAKIRLQEIKSQVKTAKETIKSNAQIVRENRKELRELKKSRKP